IAVVVAGRPHVLTDVVSHSEATIWAGYPGPFGGEAIAELVLGAAEPTGRLPMTLPSHPAALPLRYYDRQSPTGVYQDVPEPVLCPFGHGLRYRHRAVSAVDTVGDAAAVRSRAALVRDSHTDAPTRGTFAAFSPRRGGTRAPCSRELLAVARVHLRPGEQQRLELLCPAGRFFADPADPASRTDLDVEGRLCVVAPSPT